MFCEIRLCWRNQFSYLEMLKWKVWMIETKIVTWFRDLNIIRFYLRCAGWSRPNLWTWCQPPEWRWTSEYWGRDMVLVSICAVEMELSNIEVVICYGFFCSWRASTPRLLFQFFLWEVLCSISTSSQECCKSLLL